MRLVKETFRGLSAYIAVLPLFSKLGLWRYVLLTGAIAIALLLLAIPAAILGAHLITRLLVFLPDDLHAIWLSLITIGVAIGLLALFILIFKHLLIVATSPWMGVVAEKVEQHMGMYVPSTQSDGQLLRRSVQLNMRLLIKELFYSIPLLLLGLIPVINLLSSVCLVLVQSFYVGAGTLDYAVERRNDYRSSIAYYNRHKGLCTGVGAGFVLLLLTVVGVVLAPAWSAAAGAYAYCTTKTTAT